MTICIYFLCHDSYNELIIICLVDDHMISNTYLYVVINSLTFVQVGHQAIHLAAGVGNMAVVKLLIERYKVSATPTDKVHTTNTVSHMFIIKLCIYAQF